MRPAGGTTESFHGARVTLTLPRFRLEYSRQLADDLTALEMGIAFDKGRADFARIADVSPDRLYISRVEQKTFVTSAPPTMRVDRPFVFTIRERLSRTVLFLGIMNVVGE